MTETMAKKLVREKYGNRCGRCSRTDEENIRLTGRNLHVHRLVPGSRYTVNGCILLCADCHDAAHGKKKARRFAPIKKPRGTTPVINFRLGASVMSELDDLVEWFAAESNDRESRSSVMRKLVNREYDRRKKKGRAK